MKLPPFFDLARLTEAERLELIGEAARSKIVGVAVEDEAEKIDRYVSSVTTKFPDVRHIKTAPGIAPKTVLIQFGPRLTS